MNYLSRAISCGVYVTFCRNLTCENVAKLQSRARDREVSKLQLRVAKVMDQFFYGALILRKFRDNRVMQIFNLIQMKYSVWKTRNTFCEK